MTLYLMNLISQMDLDGLMDYWLYLKRTFFSRLDPVCTGETVDLLECNLFCLYLSTCFQQRKMERAISFLESEIRQRHPSKQLWDSWHASCTSICSRKDSNIGTTNILPRDLAIYFDKKWSETLQKSLSNFLSKVLSAIPLPALLQFNMLNADRIEIKETNNLLSSTSISTSNNAIKSNDVVILSDVVSLPKDAQTSIKRSIKTAPVNISLKVTIGEGTTINWIAMTLKFLLVYHENRYIR